MFTDCPTCQRQFRLTARHLSAAAGLVRCGFCGTQFNALDRLHDAPLEPSTVVMMAPAPELEEPDFDIAFSAALPSAATVERPAPAWSPPLDPEVADEAGRAGRGWGWPVVVLLLLLVGAGQLAWFQRDIILARYPALLPHLERLCTQPGCNVLRNRDLGAISVLNRDVRVHPRYQDALLVNATVNNGAPFAQPFPRIQLAFSDTSGRIIAARAFAPGEYLDDSIDQQRGMEPGTPVHVVLEIVGVGAEAVSFEIGFM